MNSNRSYNGPNRPRHNTGGRPPRSAQRLDHNNSDRFMDTDEFIRTLERKIEEQAAEIVSLRDFNFTHQLTIKEMRKELQGRPAAKTAEKFSPRQNDPIRHDAHPQTNSDRSYRNGARSDAIGMAIPVSSTIALAPKPTIRKSFSGPAPVLNTDTAIRRSPASAVPAKSPDDRYRTDAEIDALIASVKNGSFS